MASILVTGANGFIGHALCTELARRGYNVLAAQRHHEGSIVSSWKTVKVPNVGAGTDWTEALHDTELVIHLAARVHVMRENSINPLDEFRKVNVAGTERLAISAAANGVKRLVFVSSIGVNGAETSIERPFSEEDVAKPHSAYAHSKWEAEQVLYRIAKEYGIEVCVVRPPLVYGCGVPGNFLQMMEMLARGIPLPLASVRNLRSLIYVDNLVDALILCATHPAAIGQCYLVSDGEDVSTSDLLVRLGAEIGHPARLLPVPVALLEAGAALLGRRGMAQRLCGSLRVDNSKVRAQLGWTPPISIGDGLCRTAEWFSTRSIR